MSGSYQTWTEVDEIQLRAMASVGLSLSVIARKLGRPRESVRQKARHLGIKVTTRELRPFTPEEDLRLLSGASADELARELGRTKNSVYSRMRRLKYGKGKQ